MNGVEFSYYSFTRADYERILVQHGFALTEVHTDEGGNTYYLARKREGGPPAESCRS